MPLAWFDPESLLSINLFSRSHFWEVSPFVGVFTLFLIFAGLFLVRDRNRHLTVYFLGMALFALLMSMGTRNPLYPFILEKLPYFRAPGRILLLWAFSLAVLAGVYLDQMLSIMAASDKRSLFKKPAIAITGISLITISLIIWWNVDNETLLRKLLTFGDLAVYDEALLQALLQRSTLILGVSMVMVSGLFWLATMPAVRPRLWSWLA